MDLTFNSRMEEYYQRFIDLQEKLRKSEEERLKLEIKFNEMQQIAREEEQVHYGKLRSQYKRFLDEDRKRQERNEKIIRTLERIEARVNSLMSKTERIKVLRRQYQSYINRLAFTKSTEKLGAKKLEETADKIPDFDQRRLQKSKHEKLELLDKYLESMQAWKTDNIEFLQIDPSPKNSGRDLKLLEEISEKLNRNFDSNKAHAIAEDIMNSIYSRHYKKDGEREKYKTAKKYTEMGDSVDDEDYVAAGDDKKPGSVLEHLLNSKTNLTIEKPNLPSSLGKDNNYKTLVSKSGDKMPEVYLEQERNFRTSQLPHKELTAETEKSDVSLKSTDNLTTPSKKFGTSINENSNYEFSKQNKGSLDKPLLSSAVDNNYTQPKNWDSPKLSSLSNTSKFKIGEMKSDIEKTQELKRMNEVPSVLKSYPTQPQQICTSEIQKLSKSQEKTEDLIKKNNENKSVRTPFQNYDNDRHIQQSAKVDHVIQDGIDSEKSGNLLELEQHVEQYAADTKLPQQHNEGTPEKLLHEKKQLEQQIQPHNKEFFESNQHANPELLYDEKREQLEPQQKEESDKPEEYGYQYDENVQPTTQFDEIIQPVTQYNKNDQSVQQYDENEQPITKYEQPRMQYDENNYPITNYNENNQSVQQYEENVQSKTYYDKDNPHTIQYDENSQPGHQYDESGQLVMQYEAQYDENGQLIQQQYDKNGQLIQQHYNENGQLLQQQYDENGQLIQQQYDENEQLIQQQYDENGQLIQQHYDENGQLIQQQYDENGQLIQQQYDENGQLIQQQYDENGQLIQQQYDENGQLIQQQYDENGQLIQQQYDKNGQLIQQQYDENGQLIQQQYDENGQLIQPQYDENGQLIQQQYDESGQFVQNYPQYDENGQPISYDQPVLQYDENGQLIQAEYEASHPEMQTEHGKHFGEPIDNEHTENTVHKEENINKDQLEENKNNVLDILDTDTESARQNTSKISNDSDFDFSNG